VGVESRRRRPAEEPRIARHHDWLEHNRDLDGDGLIWIVQPDESASTLRLSSTPCGLAAHDMPGFLSLVQHNRHLGYDLRRVAASGWPVVCEVATNVLYSLSRTALGRPSLTEVLLERSTTSASDCFTRSSGPPSVSRSR